MKYPLPKLLATEFSRYLDLSVIKDDGVRDADTSTDLDILAHSHVGTQLESGALRESFQQLEKGFLPGLSGQLEQFYEG